ncbi:cation diffusion facilitator family transporter [Candidatus Laterigemmans baculatus]|uniref:cation diffusion facilitator family transporter n=1 Tax=Candidatus Laterigemmans baculatus TaxID=2770505 RepID=UPI001F318CB9|nr:cation diffusion facilitator family transporter [Candidatus Laterigemmans baculatus]
MDADSHAGHAHDVSGVSDSRLLWAVGLNQLLTLGQIVAGVFSGSLALMADALHNFNDAMALLIAYIARRVSRRQATKAFTFGYRRAELIGAMINLTALAMVGLYLIYEAVMRFIEPKEITGWLMMAAAGLALVVDIATAVLLWVMSRGNLNVRAAFVHNMTDAAASVAVLLGGLAIIYLDVYWIDPLLTLVIAGYVLYQALTMLPKAARILMGAAPPGIDFDEVVQAMQGHELVEEIHHVHIWQLDESHCAMEAHVVIDPSAVNQMRAVKHSLKRVLEEQFEIGHSTLEFELSDEQLGGTEHHGQVTPH